MNVKLMKFFLQFQSIKPPEKVSIIFSTYSIGMVIGSLLPNFARKFSFDKLLMLFFFALLDSLSLFLTPLVKNLSVLTFISTINGIVGGFIDAAVQEMFIGKFKENFKHFETLTIVFTDTIYHINISFI